MRYRFDPFVLDPTARRLTKDGVPIKLQPKALDVLIALVDRKGQLVAKEELLSSVWGDAAVDEGAIAVHVSALRKILTLADNTSPIETVPRLGYRFTATIVPEEATAAPASDRRPIRRVLLIATGALVIIGIMAALLRDRPVDRAPGTAGAISLAVVPFQAVGLSAQDEYVGLGLADALATQLGVLPQFGVRPTTAVIERARLNADPIAVGRALGVQYVVSGMVQRVDERVRVTVQLTEVTSGAQRWSDRIDAPASDLLRVQDTVAASVAGSLIDRFSSAERARLQSGQTANPEAYTHYLRGRVFMSTAQAADLQRAVESFERAVALDPNYVMGFASLSTAHRLLGIGAIRGSSSREAMPRARDAARQALALDADAAEAHMTMGMVSFQYDWDWTAAEASLRRAVGLNPNSADARRSFGWFLSARGRFDEGLEELRRATELDPMSILARENYGVALGLSGRYPQALEELRRATAIDPKSPRPYFRQVPFYEALGQFDRAVGVWGEGLRASGATARATAMDEAFKRGGYAAVVRLEDPGPNADDPLSEAVFAAALNDGPRLLDALARMVDTRNTWVPFVKVDRRFDLVRGQARFVEVFRAVGL